MRIPKVDQWTSVRHQFTLLSGREVAFQTSISENVSDIIQHTTRTPPITAKFELQLSRGEDFQIGSLLTFSVHTRVHFDQVNLGEMRAREPHTFLAHTRCLI